MITSQRVPNGRGPAGGATALPPLSLRIDGLKLLKGAGLPTSSPRDDLVFRVSLRANASQWWESLRIPGGCIGQEIGLPDFRPRDGADVKLDLYFRRKPHSEKRDELLLGSGILEYAKKGSKGVAPLPSIDPVFTYGEALEFSPAQPFVLQMRSEVGQGIGHGGHVRIVSIAEVCFRIDWPQERARRAAAAAAAPDVEKKIGTPGAGVVPRVVGAEGVRVLGGPPANNGSAQQTTIPVAACPPSRGAPSSSGRVSETQQLQQQSAAVLPAIVAPASAAGSGGGGAPPSAPLTPEFLVCSDGKCRTDNELIFMESHPTFPNLFSKVV